MSPILDSIGSAKGYGWGAFSIPPAFESISTAVGTGSSGTITFSSIPQTYKHLQIRVLGRAAAGGNASSNATMRFNGDTSNSYVDHFIEGAGSGTPQSSYTGSADRITIRRITQGSAATANMMGVGIIDILDYVSNTKNTTIRAITGVEDNNTVYSTTDITSGLWINTSPVTSITLTESFGNNYNTQSIFSLYGIRG